jgi:SAM-dependent methyltransferase
MSYAHYESSSFERLRRRLRTKIRVTLQGRIKSFDAYLPYVSGKSGLEVGGPSGIFREGGPLPIYTEIGRLDNCDFSASTVWATHTNDFYYSAGKAPGNTIFCDGSDLVNVANASYQLLLSAHNLEHFANPVKALKEWQRVLSPKGALILVLPNRQETFDHRRQPTAVDHMLEDYELNTGEDDLTHLQEIIEKHDLSRDAAAGSPGNFLERCQNNFSNRCLHHHVFDEQNSRELLEKVGFKVLAVELAAPFHICLLTQVI